MVIPILFTPKYTPPPPRGVAVAGVGGIYKIYINIIYKGIFFSGWIFFGLGTKVKGVGQGG